MKRVLRWMGYFGAVFSILLSIGAGIFWYRSYRYHEEYAYSTKVGLTSETTFWFFTTPDCFTLNIDAYDYPESDRAAFLDRAFHNRADGHFYNSIMPYLSHPRLYASLRNIDMWSFSAHKELRDKMWSTEGIQQTRRLVHAPFWTAILLFLILPVWQVAHIIKWYRRARRIRRGLCIACGYDLRASRERCPECGLAVKIPAGPAELLLNGPYRDVQK